MLQHQQGLGVLPKRTCNLGVSGIPYNLPLVVHFSHGSKPGLSAITWFSSRNNGLLDQHLKSLVFRLKFN